MDILPNRGDLDLDLDLCIQGLDLHLEIYQESIETMININKIIVPQGTLLLPDPDPDP